jgi:hypothetical protein
VCVIFFECIDRILFHSYLVISYLVLLTSVILLICSRSNLTIDMPLTNPTDFQSNAQWSWVVNGAYEEQYNKYSSCNVCKVVLRHGPFLVTFSGGYKLCRHCVDKYSITYSKDSKNDEVLLLSPNTFIF